MGTENWSEEGKAKVQEWANEAEELKAIFKKWQKGNWKDKQEGFAITKAEAIKIAKAFEFFHGTKATIEGGVTLTISHKDGLVEFETIGLKVTSPGYGA